MDNGHPPRSSHNDMLQHQITITNMKNTLLLNIFLAVMATSLSAQTTRPGVVLNEDSCYLYAVDSLPILTSGIYDSDLGSWCLLFFTQFVEPNAHTEIDMSARYPANNEITIYGIAITSPAPMLENMHLDISMLNSSLMVNRVATVSHNAPYIVSNYKYETNTQTFGYVNFISPSYEYYFDRPIHIVADSFYAGIRIVTSQPPYDEYKQYYTHCLMYPETFYNITNVVNGTMFSMSIGALGQFFPIVKLPCPRLDKPHLGANVGGMALFTWDTAEGASYQIGISQGDDSSYSFVHLSDTLRGGSDTSVWSRWSEGRRFYYTPDPAAIAPSDLQPPTFDLYPNPTTGILNVELGNLDFEGAATLQLLDPEGRLLQEFKIQNPKFQIDLSPYPSGTYLLRAAGATRRVVKK